MTCTDKITSLNTATFTFVLVKWRHDTVVLAHLEVHLLLDTFRNCSDRYDNSYTCQK